MTISVENITFAYRRAKAVLHGINLELKPGTVTAIFGPNGSGKSTLLRCMNGTIQPQSGSVTIENRRADSMSRQEIARMIAVVPQDTPSDIPFTAAEMVMLGRFAHRTVWDHDTAEDRAIMTQVLARLNASGLTDRPYNCLSGGERQRIILARALAQQTPIILFDEPDTHLDISYRLEFYQLIRKLAEEGKTILITCHDIFLAPMFADTAILLQYGKIHSAGSANSVLTSDSIAEVFGTSISISWQQNSSFAVSLA
ncbi:MAG: ABC transporter ATP-binding protein [Anaerohalosphaeraceae bacterium]|nr:ABC transporter ATP-binding protein [Anaerohalosphaeraceae bacterium]